MDPVHESFKVEEEEDKRVGKKWDRRRDGEGSKHVKDSLLLDLKMEEDGHEPRDADGL